MNECSGGKAFEMLCLVVNHGAGAKVTKIAKANGITGATIFYGRGTIKNYILELLDLNDVRKEIVLLLSESEIIDNVLKELDKELELHKPNHGIAFTVSLGGIFGARDCSLNNSEESRCAENNMYKAVFVVVDKGKGEAVVEAAAEAGSRGATIINARGSGIHETHMLFSMAIEPEKEVVMILSESSITDSIVSSIREKLEIDKPGKGIMFIIDVKSAYGLYRDKK